MLFTKLLLALPLFASAGFAAPAKKADDLVDRAATVDPLSILNNLKSTVATTAAGITPATSPVTVNADLTALVNALDTASANLNVGAGVSLGGLSSTVNGLGSTVNGLLGSLSGSTSTTQTQLKAQLASILANTVTTINTAVGNIQANAAATQAATQAEVNALLTRVDASLSTVLSNTNRLVSGTVTSLQGSLGSVNLSSTLQNVINQLTPISVGVHVG